MKNKFYLYCILCFLFNVAGYSQSTVFESLSFESNKLGRKVSYSIYLPSDYSTEKTIHMVTEQGEKELPGPLPLAWLYGQ